MLNPDNGEQIHLVNYVEDYLDSVKSLPFDLQRKVSLMREIDAKYQEILKELVHNCEKFKREKDGTQKRRVLHCIQRALIRSQELGDEKIQIVSQMVELVENRTRQLDSHVERFEAHQDISDSTGSSGKAGQDKSKSETIAQAHKPNTKPGSWRQRNKENRENASNNHDRDDIISGTPKEKKAKTSKKKKRSKAKAEREASPADLPIDPKEPTYCLCNQVSYGEMIGCDHDQCPIEWFHFSCVGLNHKSKGKWYCPKCRGGGGRENNGQSPGEVQGRKGLQQVVYGRSHVRTDPPVYLCRRLCGRESEDGQMGVFRGAGGVLSLGRQRQPVSSWCTRNQTRAADQQFRNYKERFQLNMAVNVRLVLGVGE